MLPLFAHIAITPLELPFLEIAIIVAIILFFGGSIGSFLNVVVYRVPMGLSIVRPGSHCPRCKTPIRARHNLPVIGWLMLGGNCYDCKAPIAARYPLVELAFGLALLLLAICEPLTQGAALPLWRGIPPAEYPLPGISAYHFFLISVLGAAGLMQLDRAIVPARYWRLLLPAALVAPIFSPALRPVPMSGFVFPGGPLFGMVEGLAEGLVGAAVGTVLGVAAWPAATIGIPRRSGHLASVAAAALVGIELGWQAAVGILTFASAFFLLQRALLNRFNRSLPWLLVVVLTVTAWIPVWKFLVLRTTIPVADGSIELLGRYAPWYVPAAAAVVVFALSLLTRTIAGDKA
jgi:leader peptidase (prepilin peptidase)/N-methyltransferase